MLKTINDLLALIRKKPENPRALNQSNTETGIWESRSTSEYLREIKYISAGLTVLGLKKGDTVGILSPPSSLWTLCDIAIMQMGCVSVPIFYGTTEEHILYQVEQSEMKVIFVAGLPSRQFCLRQPHLFKHIISLDATAPMNAELVYREFIQMGKEYFEENDDISYPLDENDLATIVYTSGTTALPKGVELTQRNMMCQVINGEERMQWNGLNERYLNYLPMAHIFGRLVNLSLFGAGASIYYLNEPGNLLPSCQEIKPTVMVLIPRTIEKIYNTIHQKIDNQKNPIKKFLGKWAFEHAHHDNDRWYSPFLNFLADKILYAKIRAMFGGKLIKAITGSAKSNATHLHFFKEAGIPIYEGYGLTEACPATSGILGRFNFGYMGYPMPGVQIKLSEKGEILLRGDIVMRGYHKDPESTAKALDKDGWLHTGDHGIIEKDGSLKFLNREVEICKTSYGEFVNLCQVESMSKELPFVESMVAVAENKPFVTALLFMDCDHVELLKERLSLMDLSNEEILRLDMVKKQFSSALENVNNQLSPWQRIRDYRFIFKKMTVEDGELSPTMKQRRQFIINKYKDLVNEMYPEKSLHSVL